MARYFFMQADITRLSSCCFLAGLPFSANRLSKMSIIDKSPLNLIFRFVISIDIAMF